MCQVFLEVVRPDRRVGRAVVPEAAAVAAENVALDIFDYG